MAASEQMLEEGHSKISSYNDPFLGIQVDLYHTEF